MVRAATCGTCVAIEETLHRTSRGGTGFFFVPLCWGDEEQSDARVLSWFWGRMGIRDGVGVLVVRAYRNDQRHG